jgi:hypothetical protein
MRPTVNPVKIDLDKERTLRFDFNAMANYEDATGANALLMDWSKATAKQIKALVWGCLLHEDPALTLDQVGGMLHGGNAKMIGKKIMEAILAGSPKAKEAEDNEKK